MNSVMGIRGLSHCLNGEQTVLVSGKFRVQGNCLMLDTRPSGKRGDSNAWLFAIKGARSLSEKMLPDCGFSYRNQTDMVEKIIYFLTSLSITRPWDPGVFTSFCASQHKDNYFQQCFQIVVRLPSIWTWISDMHQFNISFVSLHALEELLLNEIMEVYAGISRPRLVSKFFFYSTRHIEFLDTYMKY